MRCSAGSRWCWPRQQGPSCSWRTSSPGSWCPAQGGCGGAARVPGVRKCGRRGCPSPRRGLPAPHSSPARHPRGHAPLPAGWLAGRLLHTPQSIGSTAGPVLLHSREAHLKQHGASPCPHPGMACSKPLPPHLEWHVAGLAAGDARQAVGSQRVAVGAVQVVGQAGAGGQPLEVVRLARHDERGVAQHLHSRHSAAGAAQRAQHSEGFVARRAGRRSRWQASLGCRPGTGWGAGASSG